MKLQTLTKSVPIGSLARRVGTWNPARDGAGKTIRYVDLGSIDNEAKQIVGHQTVAALDAPSRARQLIAAGDILVSTVRPNLNGVARVPESLDGATASTGFCVLRPGDKLDPSYLFQWVKSPGFVDAMVRRATGQSYPAVSDRIVFESEIPLPPLDEQRRIAAILDQADALRRKRREAIDRIRMLKASLLSDFIASSNRTTTVRLADVAIKITDGTHQAPTWTSSGVPFIFVSNVRNGEISLKTDKFVSEESYQDLTKYAPIERGDILYTAVGSYGHSAIVETDECFLFQRHVAHIKPNPIVIRSEFLAPLLESPIVRRQADRVAKGVAQKTVTLSDLKSFEIELPTLDEQDIFVRQARKIDDIGQADHQHLAHLDALFASLQHRAFRREL